MGVFVAANQRVKVLSGRYTWLETLLTGNMAGSRVMPNSFLNEVLFSREGDKFKPVPDKIAGARPLYTGTFGMIGAKGKPLGDKVEGECEYAGSRKIVVVKPGRDEASLVDIMVTCDHGFAPDGTPFLAPFNERTGKPIRTDEEIGEADTILLNLNGQKRRYRIQSRDGGVFEAVGNENTYNYVSNSATLGLLWRGFDDFGVFDFVNVFDNGKRRGIFLVDLPSGRFGVIRQAADANVPEATVHSLSEAQPGSSTLLEATDELMLLRSSDTELVVRGTKEQVDEAVRSITGSRKK